MAKNIEDLTALFSGAVPTAQDEELHAVMVEEFGDKSDDYVQGYIDGIQQANQALMDEVMISLVATLPITAFLKGRKGETESA